jgi:hypothetical protein
MGFFSPSILYSVEVCICLERVKIGFGCFMKWFKLFLKKRWTLIIKGITLHYYVRTYSIIQTVLRYSRHETVYIYSIIQTDSPKV